MPVTAKAFGLTHQAKYADCKAIPEFGEQVDKLTRADDAPWDNRLIARPGPIAGATLIPRRCTVRFRQVHGRPHEEKPVRPRPSVGSVLIALTVRPPEQLPAGVEFEDVVEQVIDAIRKPLDHWYDTAGRDLLMCAPDIA